MERVKIIRRENEEGTDTLLTTRTVETVQTKRNTGGGTPVEKVEEDEWKEWKPTRQAKINRPGKREDREKAHQEKKMDAEKAMLRSQRVNERVGERMIDGREGERRN